MQVQGLPLSERDIEELTKPAPVIRLNAFKPTPIRVRRLPGIERLVREAAKYCLKDNRGFCMKIARQVLLTVAPSEVARVLKEAVNAGVQYEVALAYIAHAIKGCVIVDKLEDVGDQPCVVYNGELMINTKPLVNGAYTLKEASSEFGPIVEAGQSEGALERLLSFFKRGGVM